MNSKEYFNKAAPKWDRMVFHDARKVAFIIDALKLKPTDTVLDVGCGTGVLIPYLAGKCGSVLAVDEAEKMIETAAAKYQYPNVEFKAVSFESIDGKFDKIIMYSMFPHFNDQAAAVRRAAGLLKNGGKLMIAHSQSRDEINHMHKSMSLKLPSAVEFAALLASAGLRISQTVDSGEMYVIAADKI